MSSRLSSHFSLFKQSAPRAFDYTPRYYDEEKERKAEIKAMIAAGDGGTAEASIRKERLSKRMSHQWHRKHTSKASSTRLIGILAILCGILYIFYKNYLPTL